MPLRLNLGFTQKLGQPDFGSIGASCTIECELDSELLFRDPGGFQKQVQGVYAACTQAVHDELARHQNGAAEHGPAANHQSNGNGHHSANGNAHANGASNGASNGNGARTSSGRLATQSQVRAIHAIANRPGLELPELLRQRFGLFRVDELSLVDASHLIDELKLAPANGTAGGH